ncbi:Sad1/UNC domain-containing protein [Nannizzia gypsea CBS 118893]|uniref:Sad1/UNC domain-containing protein n=1 Tax=Arthroderma gypseum (strain ATCC MYA-4604 / CBS 118893) TaxID=535722 RepID=E4UTC6_ARTGP|nr:Sad1/UNC domain-containing protein [Nannizzia gypsea CBS 118893]EFR00687.1 Sad1/UNC domain-containing protein [Nannizzia gypsea CBS 118893]
MNRQLSPHWRKRSRQDRITSAFLAFLAVCSAPGPAAAESVADSSRLMAVDKSNTICEHVSGDLGAEYIRYPICLETRWNAAATTASSATAGGEGPPMTGSAGGVHADARDSPGSVIVPVRGTVAAGSSKSGESRSSGSGDDADVESPLDTSNFLSFEEWKNQNLAKAGQSAETMRRHRQDKGQQARRRHTRSSQINDPLDGLGEDSEIDLEFGGFSTDESGIASWERKDGGKAPADNMDAVATRGGAIGGKEGKNPSQPVFELDGQDAENMPRKGIGRRKHAGTTCKERFNYASFDCAATVLKTNRQCTGSSAVLNENKDSYMLNECRAKDKFLIMELCDDILVDTVVLANYEFFSSIFRSFRVSVSDRYPIKADKWRVLGTYEAANARQVQAFAVENPFIWARYLKIEFLSHYGNEFYCPVSLVRVHGTTMMEEYKNDGEAARADEEEDANAQEEAEQQQQQQEQADVVVHEKAPIPTLDIDDQMVPLSNLSDHELNELRCFVERNETESILLGLVSGKMCAIKERAVHAESQPVMATRVKDETAAPASGSITSINTLEQIRSVSSTRASTASDREETRRSSTGSSVTANGSHTEPAKMNSAPYTPPPSSPPPNPSTQESFFKSVNKRLQMLETNSTLSLLYIEEQSRILRDAFNKVEKRQLAKTSTFLENLNSTVLQELKEFRQQYDHLWHSVFIEFEQQRQQYHREVYSIAAQLGVLADELVFQKRVAVIQSIFVLVCFGLVLFSRSSGTPYFEFPRNIVSRTRSFRSSSVAYDSPAPSASPSPPPMSRMGSLLSRSETDEHRLHHSRSRHLRSPSEQTDYEGENPTFTYSPPTPTSRATTPDRNRTGKRLFSPEPEPRSGLIASATSSPASGSDPDLSLRQRPVKSVEVKHESESDAEQAEVDSFT